MDGELDELDEDGNDDRMKRIKMRGDFAGEIQKTSL